MENLFDEFSKSLAEPVFGVPVFGRPVSRRETLRRLGAVFAGAVLAPLGLGTAVWAHGPDPCRAFCQCRTKAQQSQCLAACRACNSDPSHVCGSCGNYACSDLSSDPNCGACGHDCDLIGETCCGDYCADLDNDEFNCGRCGSVCAAPPLGGVVACVSGTCVYNCAPGAVDCNGTCTYLGSDPDNCGACGNVCPVTEPYCNGNGVCFDPGCAPGLTWCQGTCVDLNWDNFNCGACGHQCAGGSTCWFGFCQSGCPDC